MNYDDFIEGLNQRGFQYTDEICNKGGCHKDEKHFVLLTDGLVIYSNFWDWNSCGDDKVFGNVKDGLYEIWCLESSDLDPTTKEFTFKELDEIMKI